MRKGPVSVYDRLRVGVFNAIFKNISIIWWRSVFVT